MSRSYTKFSKAIARKICEELINGASLRSVCAKPGMPHFITVLRWVKSIPGFREDYDRALEARADTHIEDILELADELPRMVVEGNLVVIDKGWVNRQRLRIDTRKWVAAKMKPKKYGDRIMQELTGAGGSPLAPPVINIGFKNGGPGAPVDADNDRGAGTEG